tara:strand:+ start:410 stop:775 length:366 start_codon:yes stop_codon:yes gene_type:complete
MPKEIYKKNIKKLDKQIKDTDAKIISIEKNIDKFYANPKFVVGNKFNRDLTKNPNTKKEFDKIFDQERKLFKLKNEKLTLKNKKTKNENLLLIENLRPKTGIGSRLKKYQKLTKAEKKGLL